MSNLHIEIKRPKVMHLVALESAYLAVKRTDADALCDTVPIVEADDEILVPMWMKSCARLLAFLRLHLRRKDGFWMIGSFDRGGLHLCLRTGFHPVHLPDFHPGIRSNFQPIFSSGFHPIFPSGFQPDESMHRVLSTALTAWLTKDILAAWLSMALPEREPSCRAEADEILLSLEQVFASCRHPMRVRKRMEVV